ncbi:MAG: alpha/beta hydrolase, partial [Chloroflexia bacterium]|nr:alpha/beta hydrolase [Chloroflexia bacterium]
MHNRIARPAVLLVALFTLIGSLWSPVTTMAGQQLATPETLTAEALADPEGAFIEVDGVRFYYVARGLEDGPVVLLLHGLLGSTLSWTATIDALASAGHRVIAFDQPPFGLSEKSPALDYSVAAQADRTIGLMDALGIERVALVGHSGGGPLAGTIAERYPDRVSKLVLVAPAYLGLLFAPTSGDEAPDATHPAAASPRPGRQPSFTLFPVLFDPANDPRSPDDQARLREAIAAERAALSQAMPLADASQDPFRLTRIVGWEAGLLAHGVAWLNDPAIMGPNPAAITAPILLVWGEGDGIAGVGEQLQALFPGAAAVIYPGVGHFPM